MRAMARATNGDRLKLDLIESGRCRVPALCVLAKVVTRASARQVCLAFAQALSTYGLPDEVLTDNGTQFTGRLLRPLAILARPSSSGSVGRTASSSASPRWPAPRRPARSSASTRPCARCSKSTGPSPTPRRPRPPSTPGGRTTTRTGRISPWTWPLPPAASCLVPAPSPTSCSPLSCGVLHGAVVITPEEEPEHFVPEPNGAEEDLHAVEFSRVFPACGNLSIGEQQVWIGPKWAGRTVSFWADTVSVHVSLDRQHLKTVPSRLSINSLQRLVAEGAVPAGPPPRTPAATGLRACGCHLGTRAHSERGRAGVAGRHAVPRGLSLRGRAGAHRLGRRCRPRCARWVVARSFRRALPPAKRQRLQGARLADATALRTEPLVVARRVSSSGSIRVGGQQVVVGSSHRRKIVEVLVEHRYLRIRRTRQHLRPWPATPRRR